MGALKLKGPALGVFNIYKAAGLDPAFAKQHSLVINSAIRSGLAVCGSLGLGVATNHPNKLPNDLDFVTDDLCRAQDFFNRLEVYLLEKSTFYRKLVNVRTKFCPKFTTTHFRFYSPFWLPICVFVLDKDQLALKSFFRNGVRYQDYRQVYKAAEELTTRDNKVRTAPIGTDELGTASFAYNKPDEADVPF